MNAMKFKSLLFVLLAGMLTASCSDLLTEDMRTQVGDERFNTPSGYIEAANAAYTPLRLYYGTERGHSMSGPYGTDIFHEGADGAHKFFNRYDTRLNASAQFVEELWDFMYEGINLTNTVLSRAETVEDLDPEEVNVRSAEAQFLRAHYYFILVQQYGPVHITTEETEGVETEAERSPVDEVFALIESDLEAAIANLPTEAEQYGRATRPAAEHLLARVLLTRASEYYRDDAGQPDDYDRAAELATRVIDDYNFSLLDDVGEVFRPGNERNEEVVWALQYSDNPLLNEGGNNSHLYYIMVYDELPAMERVVEFGRPWRRFRPTEFTTEELLGPDTRDTDSRYEKFFRDWYPAQIGGTFVFNGVEHTVAEGDTAIYLPGVEMSEEEKQARPYTVITPSDYSGRDFPTLEKHIDPNRPGINNTDGSRDFMAFRLAETHLIAAEALLLGSGSAAEATERFNAVRRRAAFPGAESEMEIEPSELDLDAILDERGRELMAEQFRWYDLKRTGLLVERAYEHNPDVQATDLMEQRHFLRPIPQTQIDRTESNFEQNPGY